MEEHIILFKHASHYFIEYAQSIILETKIEEKKEKEETEKEKLNRIHLFSHYDSADTEKEEWKKLNLPSGKKLSILFMQHFPSEELLLFLFSQEIQVTLINTEQLSRQLPFYPVSSWLPILRKYPQIRLADYSVKNQEYFSVKNPKIILLFDPARLPLIRELLAQTQQNQRNQYSVCFVGELSARRRAVIDELSSLLEARSYPAVRILNGLWGPQLAAEIRTCRVLLNVHYADDYRIFEELRCSGPALLGTQVISETSEFSAVDHPYSQYFIFAPLSELARRTIKFLET